MPTPAMRPTGALRALIAALFFATLCGGPGLSARTDRPAARDRIEKIARASGGRVGAAWGLLDDWPSRSAVRGTERFPMQSVYKVPIAMAVLADVDAGRRALDDSVRIEPGDVPPAKVWSPLRDRYPRGGAELSLRELLRAAIVDSDGLASDVLLRLVTRPRVAAYLDSIHARELHVETSEKEMARDESVQYRNYATPDGFLDLLRALAEGKAVSDASRDLLLEWMTETPIGVRRIKGRLPAGITVAHKTGTSGTEDGLTRATNDVGILTLPDGRRLLLAVFIADSRADAAAREGVIAEIARAAVDSATAGEKTE